MCASEGWLNQLSVGYRRAEVLRKSATMSNGGEMRLSKGGAALSACFVSLMALASSLNAQTLTTSTGPVIKTFTSTSPAGTGFNTPNFVIVETLPINVPQRSALIITFSTTLLVSDGPGFREVQVRCEVDGIMCPPQVHAVLARDSPSDLTGQSPTWVVRSVNAGAHTVRISVRGNGTLGPRTLVVEAARR